MRSFESFNGDVQTIENAIKDFRVKTNAEANNQILNDLDKFIADYTSKTSVIAGLNQSEKERDLARYNSNIDKWYSGNQAEKAQAHAENEELRKKYGIKSDTGKLQHFKEGGVVRGQRGEAVPVVAHAGEMYLNESQQGSLFKLLNLTIPKLSFSMPNYSMNSGSNASISTQNYFTISSGDVVMSDESTARTYWSERDSLIRRFQSKGAKRR